MTITSLKQLPQSNIFRKGDVFVLFGELFGRGYASGLVGEARKAGMEIVGITVGRRDENNALRPLNAEELAAAEANLGGKIINVPLMAGFDLDAPAGEPTPTDLLGKLTLKSWETDKLDWAHIEKCRQVGIQRFKDAVAQVMAKLEGMIADGRNVYFAHTMAGGLVKAAWSVDVHEELRAEDVRAGWELRCGADLRLAGGADSHSRTPRSAAIGSGWICAAKSKKVLSV